MGTSYWIVYAINPAVGYPTSIHALIQIQLFVLAFAIGFLLTAIPRFLQARVTRPSEFSFFLLLYLAVAGSLLSAELILAETCFVLLLACLAYFGASRWHERKTDPPATFVLIACGVLFGACGSVAIAFPIVGLPRFGELLLFQGMLLSFILGVGGFLLPRLLGRADPGTALIKIPGVQEEKLPKWRNPTLRSLAAGLLLLIGFLLESLGFEVVGALLRAFVVSAYLFVFDTLGWPRSNSLITRAIMISLWSMLIGLWLNPFVSDHVGVLHILYLGGFGLLTLTISAQVASSHGGQFDFWQRRRSAIVVMISFVLVAVLLRVFATHSSFYLLALASAAGCFIAAIVLWSWMILPLLRSSKT